MRWKQTCDWVWGDFDGKIMGPQGSALLRCLRRQDPLPMRRCLKRLSVARLILRGCQWLLSSLHRRNEEPFGAPPGCRCCRVYRGECASLQTQGSSSGKTKLGGDLLQSERIIISASASIRDAYRDSPPATSALRTNRRTEANNIYARKAVVLTCLRPTVSPCVGQKPRCMHLGVKHRTLKTSCFPLSSLPPCKKESPDSVARHPRT